MKKIAIVLSVAAVIAMSVVFVLKYNINQTRLQRVIQEQNQILDNLMMVEAYSTDGDSVLIYVTDLWLIPNDSEHKKWCKTVGLEMDKIYSKHMKKKLGNVYTHIYINNGNGTVTEIAWYKPSGEVELYYRH